MPTGRQRIVYAGMNGADVMDEDGALPAAPPNQPAELNFDADITPEEMQMMAGMGIPFGFDTTQVWLLFPSHMAKVNASASQEHQSLSSVTNIWTDC